MRGSFIRNDNPLLCSIDNRLCLGEVDCNICVKYLKQEVEFQELDKFLIEVELWTGGENGGNTAEVGV